ncbi:hypothetical protein [Synechococcus sp. PCC 6312]|uniref:hypothetical protein n=1 Tax=Synechococcus sp. (strain ATCC 27167 / PCC 6312) TaxID=195253 RepID=UPI00029ECFCF|nr:hypothetical protein [Synechococcus sp. PCC 6312]AFY60079.1 hypothetical protein Syn6312_0871 [Synechococcus sp. PCC 6312]
MPTVHELIYEKPYWMFDYETGENEMNATTATAPIQARVAYISEPKPSKYGNGHYNAILFQDLATADDDESGKYWKNLPSVDATCYLVGDIVKLTPCLDEKGKVHHDITITQQVNSPGPAPISVKNTVVATTTGDQLEPPTRPGEWSLKQIQAALSRPLPQSLLATKKLKGNDILYIPWYVANRILDKYCPGWNWQIVRMELTAKQLFLVGELSVLTSDGLVVRSASGCEDLDCSSYGYPSSNAESMAFRRCAAKFGLGLYLYDKQPHGAWGVTNQAII